MIERHRVVLAELADRTRPNGEMCTYFRIIANDTGIPENQVRRIIRHLARKGHAEYVRGLFWEDTGQIAGSGYCVTKAGLEALK